MALPTLHQNLMLLTLLPGIGNKRILQLLQAENNYAKEHISEREIKVILKNSEVKSSDILKHLEILVHYIEQNSIHSYCVLDLEYPEQLKRSFAPPPLLFVKGNISFDYNRSVAVVGTRKFTSYGQEACESFVRVLSSNRVCIVSGLASGIDTIAHRSALQNNGDCIGVIGHGFQYCFPSANKKLYADVLDSGGAIISEFLPDVSPSKSTFPIRNKTIACLARATLVVEAADKSGSLITANDAFSENREVYAVPADITRPSYQGCNTLIRSNIAKLVTKPEDLLSDLGIDAERSFLLPRTSLDFNDVQTSFINLVSVERLTADELSTQLGMHITVINEILSELELIGVIIRDDQQRWMICN